MLDSNLVKLLINLSLAILLLLIYIGLWKACNKLVSNKIIKGLIIGILTPFLSFGFVITLATSIVYFFYVTNESSEPDTSGGAFLGITFMFGIPISILWGIINALFIFLGTSLKNEVIQSMKNDVRNLLKSIRDRNY